ncbi:MAG: DNA topoisomerase I [Candidatus Methanodesulfokora sp.]
MRKILIITEKPNVAERIAKVLSRERMREEMHGKVRIYRFYIEGVLHTVVPASGHLFQLDYPEGRWTYPIIVEPEKLVYKPIPKKKDYINAIKRESVEADLIIVATDLDTEGSAIGLEILDALEIKKDVRRMEFSSLSEAEIRRSYENLRDMDYGRAYAGFSRRVLDLEWGANVTRALTLSTRNHRWVKLLSSGRVQGPTLKMIVDREREIRNFVPEKFYVIKGVFEADGTGFDAVLSSRKRIKDPEFIKSVKSLLGLESRAEVRERKISLRPPPPFDGTTMQIEVSSITGLTPRQIADRTRGIAQQLYEAGLISYIGTESQKYPKSWKKEDFLDMIRVIESYGPLSRDARWVLENLRERAAEGKKDDPAHPCIHIVGAPERGFPTENHRKVYEIIARRVLATLSPDGEDLRTRISVRLGDHVFIARGAVRISDGWRRVYPFIKSEEKVLPKIENGQKVRLIDVKVEEKETQPPKRYTPRSLIREMERLGLGTKNTRAVILDLLKERGYIEGKTFRPTKVGERVVEVLSDLVPEIVDPRMTAKLDEAMRRIEMGELNHMDFLKETLDELSGYMMKFKELEKAIGERISSAIELKSVGKCPKCGGSLVLRRSRFGPFVICVNNDVKYDLMPGERVLEYSCECGLPLVAGSIRTKKGRNLGYERCLGNCSKSPLRCSSCSSTAMPKRGKYGIYIKCSSCSSVNFFKSSRAEKR